MSDGERVFMRAGLYSIPAIWLVLVVTPFISNHSSAVAATTVLMTWPMKCLFMAWVCRRRAAHEEVAA